MELTYEAIARRIDHALLLPTTTEQDMIRGCHMAAHYGIASVCVKPFGVKAAAKILSSTPVKIGTVIGFPHGGQTIQQKIQETKQATETGAAEIDMVINIGQLLSGDWETIERELRAIRRVATKGKTLLKVIFETCYLNTPQKLKLCELCNQTEVDFAKTSTGFGPAGATESDIILMRTKCTANVKIKASGGIKNLEAAICFSQLGADRLGTSRTTEILDELRLKLNLPSIHGSWNTNDLEDSSY